MNPFLNNKYSNWYAKIISNAQQRQVVNEYCETHHIIPRCLFPKWIQGNPDDAGNLVQLTAREHFICHILLTKMVVKDDRWRKMCHAMLAMARKSPGQYRHQLTSWEYKFVREQYSLSRKGQIRIQTQQEKDKRSKMMTGRTLSQETKTKISLNNKGKKWTQEQRDNHWMKLKGPPVQSIETRLKRSKTLQGHMVSAETRKKIGEKNRGKTKSPSSNEARSIALKNTSWINNGSQNLRIKSNDLAHYLADGWIKGRLSVK